MNKSYREFLRTSVFTGGSAVAVTLIGAVTIKFAAVLLGPAGVGELRVFQSLTGLVTSVIVCVAAPVTLVQGLARARTEGDIQAEVVTVFAGRWMAWVAGAFGGMAVALFATPVSDWIFGDDAHARPLAIVAASIPLATFGAAQIAILRGLRRIATIAWIGVVVAALSAITSIACYTAIGLRGIAPALVLTALYGAIVPIPVLKHLFPRTDVSVPRKEVLRKALELTRHGSALSLATIAGAGVAFAIPSYVAHQLGSVSVGLYAAAWALSGLFANFLLGAMGADFLPRLSGTGSCPKELERLTNEQTEIVLLIALPGLIASIAFAGVALRIFYSQDFVAAEGLLVWCTAGVFGKLTSWPLAYVLLAKRMTRSYVAAECSFAGTNLLLTILTVRLLGLQGTAVAFCASYIVYNVGVYCTVRSQTGIHWNRTTWRLILVCFFLMAMAVASKWMVSPWNSVCGVLLTVCAAVFSTKQLVLRLAVDGNVFRKLCARPIFQRIMPEREGDSQDL